MSEENRQLQIDALNMCPPIGAMYASYGIHACVPLSHGATGCCRFQRMELAKHFQKICRVASSILREREAVFGGADNLYTALDNAFASYDPEIIAVHSTCMSETIGDDLEGILADYEPPEGKYVIYASTPGYSGSRLTGYAMMTKSVIEQLVAPSDGTKERLCLIPGWVNPSDVREIVRYAKAFFPNVLVLPDLRDVMDEKTPKDVRGYCSGGTTVSDIIGAADSRFGISLGEAAAASALDALAKKGVGQTVSMPLPVGIGATDDLISRLREFSGKPVPAWIVHERQRAVDVLTERVPFFYGKTAAIFCDADLSIALTRCLAEIGITPLFVCTGWAEPHFEEEVQKIFNQYGIDGCVMAEADRYDMEQFLEKQPVDLLFGESRGKILSRRFHIPLVRIGFPITDRSLAYLDPVLGYQGFLCLLRDILWGIAEQEDANLDPEDLSFSKVM